MLPLASCNAVGTDRIKMIYRIAQPQAKCKFGFSPSNLVFFLNIQWNSYFLLHNFKCRKKRQDEGFKEFFKDLVTLKKTFHGFFHQNFFSIMFYVQAVRCLVDWPHPGCKQDRILRDRALLAVFFNLKLRQNQRGQRPAGGFNLFVFSSFKQSDRSL